LNFFTNNPINKTATTLPPKVVDLKFRPAPGYYNDGDVMQFDFIELNFGYISADVDSRSEPKQFFIQIQNLDTGEVKGFIQDAADMPYLLWQRTLEKYSENEEYTDIEIKNGVVNGKIKITPINDKGRGSSSVFFLPLNKLNYIGKMQHNTNPSSLVLSKFWHLYSLNPDNPINRPKTMYIYIDTDLETIISDKEKLFNDEWARTSPGDWKQTNQETFRWALYEGDFLRLDHLDTFQIMSEEEKSFLKYLIDSFNDIHMHYLNDNGIGQGAEYIFKIAVQNPMDHKDSIVIYIMRGKSWEI
jgi:hypothetical protein